MQLVVLLSDGCALAADYNIDFGVETTAGKDAGTLTCLFDEVCSAKVKLPGLGISIFVSRSEPELASVRLHGDELNCCYFDGAADSKIIDPRTPVSRVAIFKGASARGALFIENEHIGTLYLRFDYR